MLILLQCPQFSAPALERLGSYILRVPIFSSSTRLLYVTQLCVLVETQHIIGSYFNQHTKFRNNRMRCRDKNMTTLHGRKASYTALPQSKQIITKRLRAQKVFKLCMLFFTAVQVPDKKLKVLLKKVSKLLIRIIICEGAKTIYLKFHFFHHVNKHFWYDRSGNNFYCCGATR